MSSTVDKIKERLSIEDVVASYVKLERAGSNLKGKCPFHAEKTPSFFVSPERASYYCFGCGAKGDIFTFIQEFEGLDFYGSLKVLAEKAGVEIERVSSEKKEKRDVLADIMQEALDFYQSNLKVEYQAYKYLLDRGLTKETIENFSVGYAPADWRTLSDHLVKKGFKLEEIEKAGLAKRSDKKPDTFYDRFRGRIMFPIFDSSNRPIAFSGRIFPDDDKSAKYINSPETPLFSKSDVLYGVNFAKAHIRKNNFSILVEGQFDLLMSHQAGFKNTVALSGTALNLTSNPSSHFRLIKRLSSNIVIVFDSDPAGIEAAKRNAMVALQAGMDVKVSDLEEGMDPADIILKDVTLWKKAIREAKHIVDFLLDKVEFDKKDSRKFIKEIRDKVLPFVLVIESEMEKDYFLTKIAERAGLSKDSIIKEMVKKAEEEKSGEDEQKKGHSEVNDILETGSTEMRLWGIILWQKNQIESSFDTKEKEEKFFSIIDENLIKKFQELSADDQSKLIFEAENYYGGKDNIGFIFDDLIESLEKEYLKKEYAEAIVNLKKAEGNKDEKKVIEYLKICQEISNKLKK